MVQVSMGRLSPYIKQDIAEGVIDVVPTNRKIKKTIFVNGKWEDRVFIRIPVGSNGNLELEQWCKKHYGNPRYLGPWFMVSGYVILDEKTYVHWKLCE